MAVTIADAIEFTRTNHRAVLATRRRDGRPQLSPVTVAPGPDGQVLISTRDTAMKVKNIERDPRVTVLIHSADNPWDWAEVRGHLVDTIDGQAARDHIDALSRKYIGQDYANPIGPHGRVILRIAADKTNTPGTMSR